MSLSLREIIQEIAKEIIERDFGIPCKVLSYDEDEKTIDCEPLNEKADFVGVKLQAEVSSGVLIVPKLGSIVVVEQTSGDSAYVTMYGEIEGIELMNGENKGLVKVSELVQKLNALESDINTLKGLFSSWAPVTSDGGAALKTLTTNWSGQQLQTSQVDDLENEKITH